MNSRMRWVGAAFAVSLLGGLLCLGASPVNEGRIPRQADTFAMTPAQYWAREVAQEPWMIGMGDADGDGRADIIKVSTSPRCTIDMSLTSEIGKPNHTHNAWPTFGKSAVAMACGPFVRKAPNADVMGVFADGSVRIAWGMERGTGKFQHADDVGRISPEYLPTGPIKCAVGDFGARGRTDVLLAGQDGELVLLLNEDPGNGGMQFSPHPFKTKLSGLRRISAGVLDGDPRAQIVWLDSTGVVRKAFAQDGTDGLLILATQTPIANASPEDHIAVGRFRGRKTADVLVGQHLFAGGDPKAMTLLDGVPTLEKAKDDGDWIAADVDGNGKDDLVRLRTTKERFRGGDVVVHFSYDASDKQKGYYSSSHDGLPDFWKEGKFKPGGLDLQALGCKVGHRDIIILIDRYENVDENYVHSSMARATRYFASLPIENPDGTTGIMLHYLYDKPWPLSQHEYVNSHFDELFPPEPLRGVIHFALAEKDGPLNSVNCGDRSRFNGGPLEFIHEFGHQLWLGHEGFWSEQCCPLYPSLMNYSYNYSVGDDGNKAGYSDGSFLGFTIHPLALPKHIPFPIEKLKCLAGNPYKFKLKPDDTGQGTFVDWNWNGLFDDTAVVACVNYSQGMYLEPRFDIAKTQSAPVLVNHGGGSNSRLLLIYGQAAGNGLGLVMKTWLGPNRDANPTNWSQEVVLEDSGVLGDPTATYLGDGVTWVAYQTGSGVVLKSITLDNSGRPILGPSKLVPKTTGAQPTLTALNGRLALFLWRGRSDPVGFQFLRASGSDFSTTPEGKLDIVSEGPIGVAAGRETDTGASLWVTRIDPTGSPETLRYGLGSDGKLQVADRSTFSGKYAKRRVNLLWEMEPGLLPEGRLYQFLSGAPNPQDKPWCDQRLIINTPYKDADSGWLVKRYEKPVFTSVSATGACFYGNNIVFAMRQYDADPKINDNLVISFYGNGANPNPIGDFDDISHIRDFGLSRSITWAGK